MDEKTKAFLREGLTRYKGALDTIRYFEDNLLTILEGIMRNRKNWGPFFPDLSSIKHEKGKTFVEAYLTGKNSQDVGIYLGMGFDCSISSPEFYVYVASIDGRNLDLKDRRNEMVPFFKQVGKYSYLFSNPEGEYDFEKEFNFLLDEFLANIIPDKKGYL